MTRLALAACLFWAAQAKSQALTWQLRVACRSWGSPRTLFLTLSLSPSPSLLRFYPLAKDPGRSQPGGGCQEVLQRAGLGGRKAVTVALGGA